MDAVFLLTNARTLLQRADPATAGIWPRATVFLVRLAIELALDDFWRKRAPGVERCSARAQLLCLPAYLKDNEYLARRVAYAWSGLSRASHHHVYELPPTFSELAGWIETVEELTAQLK